MRLYPRKAHIKSDHIIHVCPQCWITCDLCDRWYDPVCADLTDDQWADVDNFD